jgi:hypothetical protein
MKKSPKSLIKSLGHVKVNLIDILDLIEVVKLFSKKPDREYPDKDKLTISINGYILESEDEIKTFEDQKINEFRISYTSISSVHFSLEITAKGMRIYCDTDDPYNLGVFNKILELSKSYKRKFQWSDYFLYVSTLFLFGPLLVFISKKDSVLNLIGTIISYAILISFTIYLVGIPYRKTAISLIKQEKSFWLKNKDQLIIGLFGALIGGVITIVTTIILFKIGILK